MKKILISVMALAVAAMGFVSCQKDQTSGLRFTATMSEQVSGDNGKTAYDAANGLHWEAGDTIVVMSETEWGVFTATPESGNPRNAVFNECNTLWGESYGETMTLRNETAPFFAVYPADENTVMFLNDSWSIIYGEGYDINYFAYFPMEYNTVGGELTHFPMMAYSSTTNLQFKNAGGAIRLNLTKAGVNVSRIVVTSGDGEQLAGAFDSGFSVDGEPEVTVFSNPDWFIYPQWLPDSVAVNCSGAPSIAEGHDFFVPLPAGTYRNLTFTIYTNDGRVCTKAMNANATLNIVRSQYSTITLGEGSLEFVDPNAINGLFTVNANGKKVYFAKGNLQNINGEWRFAEHQYDYLGTYSATAWDLFGWSTTATNFGMSTSTDRNDYSGSFAKWGTQIGDGETWETLSKDEWNYVLNRDASKKGVGTVTTDDNRQIRGLILLPDAWTLPAGLTFNSGTGSWTRNQYTAAEWEQMEAAGAVFLPAAGYRLGTVLYSGGTYGYYWSSTPYDEGYAHIMYFYGAGVYYANRNRYCGHSVRLVQEYHGN